MSTCELRVLEGPAAGQTRRLDVALVLGRDAGVDLPIDDEEMSRRHARVTPTEGGASIEDLGSLNGTFVNGTRIERPHRLASGDHIKVGVSLLEFFAAPAPQVGRAGADVASPDLTRARHVIRPADLTREHESLSPDVTRARDIPITAGPAAGGELRVIQGATTAHVVPVVNRIVLGRDPACDIVFNDEEISRRHAGVSAAAGEVTIADLDSTNGTFVNGDRLLAPQRVEPGDRIELGSAVLRYDGPSLQVTRVRRAPAPQVSSVRQVVEHPNQLLTAGAGSRKWWTLAVVCVAMFMLLVDTTIVSVALPSISKALHASFADLQWVIDAYSAFLAAMLLMAGSLSDRLGRRQIFLIGLIVFTISSALCGLSWSSVALDVFRGVQGIGAALMLGPAAALVVQEFPAPERSVAFAVVGGVTGLGIAVGPLVGGALTDAFGWQSIFYVNVPIGIVTIALTLRRLVNISGPATKIDYGGAVTFSVGTFLVVFGLIRGNDSGWGNPLIVSALVAGVVLMVSFVFIERRAEQPIMDLAMFRIRTFNGVSAASFALSASVLALIIYITLWLQSVLGYSPLGAGLRLLAITGLTLIFAPIGGRLSGFIAPRVILGLGLALMSAGAFIMSRITADSSWTVLLPGLVLAGLGLGVSAPTLSNTSVSIVPPWRSGMASGLNYTWRQLGLATGIAVLGAVFQHEVSTSTTHLLAGAPSAFSPSATAKAIAAGGTQGIEAHVSDSVRVIIHRTAQVGFASGLRHIFLISGFVAALGALAAMTLVRPADLIARGHGGPPAGKPEAGAGPPPGAPAGPPAARPAGPPAGPPSGPPPVPPGGPPPGVDGADQSGAEPRRGLPPKIIAMLGLVALVVAGAIVFLVSAQTTPRPCATEYSTGVGIAGQALHLTSGPDGNLYATESGDAQILRFDPVTHQQKLFALPPGTIPHDIESFPGGDIWFDALNDRIGKLDPRTGAITMYPGISRGSQPHTMVYDNGYIYFSELAAGRLGRLDPRTGKITEGSYGLPAGNLMHSLVVVPGGYIWGTLSNANQLARFNTHTGRFDLFVKMPIPNSGPRDIAYLPAHHALYFTMFAANKFAEYDLTTGRITLYDTPLGPVPLARAKALSHESKLTFIKADARDRYVWAATFGPDLMRLDPNTGHVTQMTCGINLPGLTAGIANDREGNLWFNEVEPGRIARLTP